METAGVRKSRSKGGKTKAAQMRCE